MGAYMPQNTFVYVPDVVVANVSLENKLVALLQCKLRCVAVCIYGAWGCGAFGNDAAVVASAMATAMKSAGAFLDHVVLAIPREGEKFDAFRAVFGDPSVIRLNSPKVDTTSAKWTLLGALHCDSMALAAGRAAVESEDLRTAEGARRAAQVWLRELTSVCLEELVESFPAALVARLQELLNLDGDAESEGPTTNERKMSEEFQRSAQALVQEHFRTEKRNLPNR